MHESEIERAGAHAAATIWAQATGRRDGSTRSPADVLPGIERARAVPGAVLRISRVGDEPVGFVLLVPARDALEVRYLGVAPAAWGRGIGTRLLADVLDHAVRSGVSRIELWVLSDNERAIAVYERAGWRRTGDAKSQIDTRRVEQRLERVIDRSG